MKKILILYRSGTKLAGAVVWLLTLVLSAPSAARADCSHGVTSRGDRAHQAGHVGDLFRRLAAHDQSPQLPLPVRPCSGAFCSGEPAVPGIPPGSLERLVDSWVWSASVFGMKATAYSFSFARCADAHPLDLARAIFHPPRFLSFA